MEFFRGCAVRETEGKEVKEVEKVKEVKEPTGEPEPCRL